MRDWIRTLARASYRGASFHIEKASGQKAGRAVVTHKYVKSEQHATEDMGRLPREFRVQAYIANDAADADMAALLQVCSTSGPGLLVLPMFEPVMVRCTNCSPSAEKTKLGFVAFDLDFIEAGSDGAAFPAIALGDRIAASALDTLAGTVSDALSSFSLR